MVPFRPRGRINFDLRLEGYFDPRRFAAGPVYENHPRPLEFSQSPSFLPSTDSEVLQVGAAEDTTVILESLPQQHYGEPSGAQAHAVKLLQPALGYSHKSFLPPFRGCARLDGFDFDALALADDVADVHGRACFGTAFTARSARMIVDHIFWAIGRLSR